MSKWGDFCGPWQSLGRELEDMGMCGRAQLMVVTADGAMAIATERSIVNARVRCHRSDVGIDSGYAHRVADENNEAAGCAAADQPIQMGGLSQHRRLYRRRAD